MVVAFVVVALVAVKLCSVVDDKAKSCPVVVAPPNIVKPDPAVLPPIVEDASE